MFEIKFYLCTFATILLDNNLARMSNKFFLHFIYIFCFLFYGLSYSTNTLEKDESDDFDEEVSDNDDIKDKETLKVEDKFNKESENNVLVDKEPENNILENNVSVNSVSNNNEQLSN